MFGLIAMLYTYNVAIFNWIAANPVFATMVISMTGNPNEKINSGNEKKEAASASIPKLEFKTQKSIDGLKPEQLADKVEELVATNMELKRLLPMTHESDAMRIVVVYLLKQLGDQNYTQGQFEVEGIKADIEEKLKTATAETMNKLGFTKEARLDSLTANFSVATKSAREKNNNWDTCETLPMSKTRKIISPTA